MPGEEFQELEALRKQEGLSRSKFIMTAVKRFKEERKKERLAKIYTKGYQRIPENLQIAEGWEKTSLEGFPASCGGWQ
ncbi:MAG: hypothetical protein KBE27_05230 [Syntrophorhabdaceae bacterium]|nr:hypothetical protein [Syntrophorhabdaceae bacterium]